MPVGTIIAPGGKVVAVENNYGRIIVGDSWSKLIARAAITGLVAGLVLLFGQYAVPAVIAWFGVVFAWLFKRQPAREVTAAGGSAAAKVIVAIGAAALATAAPPVVKTQVIAGPGPGSGSSSGTIDAGVGDAPDLVDAGQDAAPDARVALDLSRAKVIVATRDYPGACATVQTAARPPTGVQPPVCPGSGNHALSADIDDVVVYVDYGAQGSITIDQLAASQPAIHLLADGVDVTDSVSAGARRTSGRIVDGHAVYLIMFRAPALRASAFSVVASVGDQTITADGLRLVDYPQPFKAAVVECGRRSTRGATCELDVAHMTDRITLFVRRRSGDATPVRITQRLNGDGYRASAVSPLVDELLTIAPLPRRGAAWAITVTVGSASQTLNLRLKQAP
ncbi:MAG: hypothetical protein K8W52_13405 [Deltaproteobacteria bacterium]|nr:hypothetical protein [Deltaproteobacteria bacterium]